MKWMDGYQIHKNTEQNCQKIQLPMNMNFPERKKQNWSWRKKIKKTTTVHILKITSSSIYLGNRLQWSKRSLEESAKKRQIRFGKICIVPDFIQFYMTIILCNKSFPLHISNSSFLKGTSARQECEDTMGQVKE